MPQVLAMGVSINGFWKLNPRTVKILIEAENVKAKKQFEHDNVIAHLQGQYVVEALLCTVGNMFSSKGSKKFDYPKEPYQFNIEEKEKDYIEQQRELLMSQLNTAMTNFNLAKQRERNE